MATDRESFKIVATPVFRDVYCPVDGHRMTEIQNGWFGNPYWWCAECKKPYRLELHALRKWNEEAVRKQLEARGIKCPSEE